MSQQLSDTNLVTRLYDQAELGLLTTSGPNALSTVNQTKLKVGCNGRVKVSAKSSASTVIKITTSATPVLDFGSPQTVTITVNTNAWDSIQINGDTNLFWGLHVSDPSKLTDLLVEEQALLADGECISIVQAGFDAKHVATTGDYDSTFS